MTAPPQLPVLRLDGDIFFKQRIVNKTFRIQVTHECLIDIFGSDGSVGGDNKALHVNHQRIVSIATRKVMTGTISPVKVLRDDFRTFSTVGGDRGHRPR